MGLEGRGRDRRAGGEEGWEGRKGKGKEGSQSQPPPLKNPRSATDIRRCSAVCCSAAVNIMTVPPSSNGGGGGKQHRHAAAGPM